MDRDPYMQRLSDKLDRQKAEIMAIVADIRAVDQLVVSAVERSATAPDESTYRSSPEEVEEAIRAFVELTKPSA